MSQSTVWQGRLIAGRYRLEQRLGEGGMGSVWAATHLVTRRVVAMKFLKPSARADADLRRRFAREASAASAIHHPNVVEIIDAFEFEPGNPVLVMELLRGETLADKLRRTGQLTLPETVDLILPVVSALGAAHAHGIVHRDIKPENVFLVDTAARVKVVDFGIAKLLFGPNAQSDGAPTGVNNTEAGAVLGTPRYMAPEQATGAGPVDHRADIWSVGVVLYECLSGKRPVDGVNLVQFVLCLMNAGIVPISHHVPGLPRELAQLIMRMLSRDVARRPQSLTEVAQVLSAQTSVAVPDFGPPSSAPPPTLFQPTAALLRSSDPSGVTMPSAPLALAARWHPSPVTEPARPVRRPLLGALAAFGSALLVVGLLTSRYPGHEGPRAQLEPEASSLGAKPSLKRWSGLSQLQRQLDAGGPERKRALQRLSDEGSASALRVLTQWLDQSPVLQAQDWLVVSQSLAPHAAHPSVRLWLAKILSGAPLSAAPFTAAPLGVAPGAATPSHAATNDAVRAEAYELCRGTAAFALAKASDPESLLLLGKALRQTGQTAELASLALLGHPPRQLAPLLDAPGAASAELIVTLDQLGDQRAFDTLRAWVRQGSPDVQGLALLALFHHGHMETVEVAQHWLGQATSHVGLLSAATEILLAVDSPLAPNAVARLLQLQPDAALPLLRRFPSLASSAPLLTRWSALNEAQRASSLPLLGVVGGERARALLAAALSGPQAPLAADAMARSPDALMGQALWSALQTPKTERVAARALVIRSWLHAQEIPQLSQILQRWSKDPNPERRAVGLWGLAVASEDSAQKQLNSDDWTHLAAAASSALVRSPSFAHAALVRMEATPQLRAQIALSAGLWEPAARAQVASSELHRLLDSAPALAQILAPILSAREEERLPTRIAGWLQADDPQLRAAALLGLGQNTDPSSEGQLAQAYWDSASLAPRRAAIAALSQRPAGTQRTTVLQYARDFDPDALIRASARAGLSGAEPVAPLRGMQWVWRNFEDAKPGDLVVVTLPSGNSFQALLPADKQLVVLGLASRDAHVTLHAL